MGTGLHLYRERRSPGGIWRGTGRAEDCGGRDHFLFGLLGHPRWLRALLLSDQHPTKLDGLPIWRGVPADLSAPTLRRWQHAPERDLTEAHPDWHAHSWMTPAEWAGVLGRHALWYADWQRRDRIEHEVFARDLEQDRERWDAGTFALLLKSHGAWEPTPYPPQLTKITAGIDADRARGFAVRLVWWFDN